MKNLQRAFLLIRKKLFGEESVLLPPPADYTSHWKYCNLKNKVVLDLGADFGSTANFFLRNGAKKVIAVEGNRELGKMLRNNFRKSKKVVPIVDWIDSPQKILRLIKKYKPDVVKCDIEGAEIHLLGVPLRLVKTWLVETHTLKIYSKLVEKFHKEGFRISKFPHCPPNLWVIIAERS